MANLIEFPQPQRKGPSQVTAAMQAIEKRFGVPFWEYVGVEGDQAAVREKVNKALLKETLSIATRDLK